MGSGDFQNVNIYIFCGQTECNSIQRVERNLNLWEELHVVAEYEHLLGPRSRLFHFNFIQIKLKKYSESMLSHRGERWLWNNEST